MNLKNDKRKKHQNKTLDFFQAKQNTASADSISLHCKYTTLKMLRDKAECKGTQREACALKQEH